MVVAATTGTAYEKLLSVAGAMPANEWWGDQSDRPPPTTVSSRSVATASRAARTEVDDVEAPDRNSTGHTATTLIASAMATTTSTRMRRQWRRASVATRSRSPAPRAGAAEWGRGTRLSVPAGAAGRGREGPLRAAVAKAASGEVDPG